MDRESSNSIVIDGLEITPDILTRLKKVQITIDALVGQVEKYGEDGMSKYIIALISTHGYLDEETSPQIGVVGNMW